MSQITTPFLKNHIVFSSIDHPGKLSVIYYTNPFICDMHCFYCHNRNESIELLKKGHKEVLEVLKINELIKSIQFYKLLGAELIIISGGEPLFNKKFIKFIKKYRKELDLPIRIDTNGQSPEIMEELDGLVNGYAIDIKIKSLDFIYEEEHKKDVEKKLGIKDINKYVDNLKRSIDIAIDLPYTLIRESGAGLL